MKNHNFLDIVTPLLSSPNQKSVPMWGTDPEATGGEKSNRRSKAGCAAQLGDMQLLQTGARSNGTENAFSSGCEFLTYRGRICIVCAL
jgi:hypothetical protein